MRRGALRYSWPSQAGGSRKARTGAGRPVAEETTGVCPLSWG